MAADLKDVIEYIVRTYPHGDELSNARLTKIIYLSDWVSAINNRTQITDTHWYFDNYGPFVWDVLDAAKNDRDRFRVEYVNNYYGTPKAVVKSNRDSGASVRLSDQDRKCIDHVIKQTEDLGWDAFIQLVYSTYPVMTSERYSPLDLVAMAKAYKQLPQYK